jgi:hypothetical protein
MAEILYCKERISPSGVASLREGKQRSVGEGKGWKSMVVAVWNQKIHVNAEKVPTYLRSLGTAECFQSAGDQVIQSSHYPSTRWKVCVHILTRMITCVNSHTTAATTSEHP